MRPLTTYSFLWLPPGRAYLVRDLLKDRLHRSSRACERAVKEMREFIHHHAIVVSLIPPIAL
jgi:hypothetical protein